MRKPIGRPEPGDRKDGTHKMGFDSFAQAQKHADRVERVFRLGRPASPFKCDTCGKWHVGRKGSRWR